MFLHCAKQLSDNKSKNFGTSSQCNTYHTYEDKIRKKYAKFKKLPLCQESILGTKLLNANVQCVDIVLSKYKMSTSNALIQVEYSYMYRYALSEKTKYL